MFSHGYVLAGDIYCMNYNCLPVRNSTERIIIPKLFDLELTNTFSSALVINQGDQIIEFVFKFKGTM